MLETLVGATSTGGAARMNPGSLVADGCTVWWGFERGGEWIFNGRVVAVVVELEHATWGHGYSCGHGCALNSVARGEDGGLGPACQ